MNETVKIIICPVDFSEDSYNAVQYALGLCRHVSAKLLVLHVYESPVHFTTARFAREEDIRLYRQASAEMEAFLGRVSRMPAVKDVKAEAILKNGVPSARTLELAEELDAEMIVMAPSATGPAERFILGSNATRIVVHARCKVLIVPVRCSFMVPPEIVYGCDLSQENKEAVNLLREYLLSFGAKLRLLYVQVEKAADDAESLAVFAKSLNDDPTFTKRVETKHLCDPDPAKAIRDHLASSRQGWFALYHRYRTWFAGITRPSLAKELSADPGVPVLVLNDEVPAARMPQTSA